MWISKSLTAVCHSSPIFAALNVADESLGVCGSDVHSLRSGLFPTDFPVCVGHEYAFFHDPLSTNFSHKSGLSVPSFASDPRLLAVLRLEQLQEWVLKSDVSFPHALISSDPHLTYQSSLFRLRGLHLRKGELLPKDDPDVW